MSSRLYDPHSKHPALTPPPPPGSTYSPLPLRPADLPRPREPLGAEEEARPAPHPIPSTKKKPAPLPPVITPPTPPKKAPLRLPAENT